MTAKEGQEVVDGACYCRDCTSRTKKMYRMTAACSNCGGEYVAQFRFGDKTHAVDCPHCGAGYRSHFKERVT